MSRGKLNAQSPHGRFPAVRGVDDVERSAPCLRETRIWDVEQVSYGNMAVSASWTYLGIKKLIPPRCRRDTHILKSTQLSTKYGHRVDTTSNLYIDFLEMVQEVSVSLCRRGDNARSRAAPSAVSGRATGKSFSMLSVPTPVR
jgi:hypothetical protein